MNPSIECIFCYLEVDPRIDYLHLPTTDQRAGEDLFHMFHSDCWAQFEKNQSYRKSFPCCFVPVDRVGPPINLAATIETLNRVALRMFSILLPENETLQMVIDEMVTGSECELSDGELENFLNTLQIFDRIEKIKTYGSRFSIELLTLIAKRGHAKLFTIIAALRRALSVVELVYLFRVVIRANRDRGNEEEESSAIIRYLLTYEEFPLEEVLTALPALLEAKNCPATLRCITAWSRFRTISSDSILHIWNLSKEPLVALPQFQNASGSQLGIHLVNSLELTGYLNTDGGKRIPDSYIGRAFRRLFNKLDIPSVEQFILSDWFDKVSVDELGGALLELFKTHAKSFLPVSPGRSHPNDYRVRLIVTLKDSGRWLEIPHEIRVHLYFLCKEHKYMDVAVALGSDAEYGGNENCKPLICFFGEQLISWAQGAEEPTWDNIQNSELFDELYQVECYVMQAFVSAVQQRSSERFEILLNSPLFSLIPADSLGWLLYHDRSQTWNLSRAKAPRVGRLQAGPYY